MVFHVASFEQDVAVQPSDLQKAPLVAVTEVIEQRFLDKVLPQQGLVVTVYDIQSLEGGFIYPNDGAAYFKVRFRLVLFRPFPGEVLVGRLKACTRDGLKISLGAFFHDIMVPEHALQDPSFFDDNEKLWVWKFEESDMYMDLDEEIRFRVHAVKFNNLPTPQELQNAQGDDKLLGTAARPFAPMEITGDINGDGLGLLSWWGGAAEEEE